MGLISGDLVSREAAPPSSSLLSPPTSRSPRLPEERMLCLVSSESCLNFPAATALSISRSRILSCRDLRAEITPEEKTSSLFYYYYYYYHFKFYSTKLTKLTQKHYYYYYICIVYCIPSLLESLIPVSACGNGWWCFLYTSVRGLYSLS